MRKLASIAGAALLAFTGLATPASAQSMSAGGSCGPSADNLGHSDVNSWQQNKSGDSVPALFYEVDYSGVPAPTTVGVIVRYNGELESQSAVVSFTANESGGRVQRVLTSAGTTITDGYVSSINPDFEGNSNSTSKNTGNPGGSGKAPGDDGDRFGSKDGPADNNTPGRSGQRAGGVGPTATGGALLPGEYVFYVYTGSVGDVYNTKDGTVARNAFIADEKGFLGWFSCGISTRTGTGPG